MMIDKNTARRTATRVGTALAAAGIGIVALPFAAQAHVEVQPGQVEGGDFSVVAFRVPNERDDASTTRLRVLLPKDRPLGSVQTTAMPGWKVATVTRRLSKPLTMEGAKVSSVVSEVTWTATQGGVRPGQFEDFRVSLGQLPTSGKLVFNAVQTYSDGAKVLWNEVSADKSAEAEHPAPTLSITAPGSRSATSASSATEQTSAESSTRKAAQTKTVAAPTRDNDSSTVLPTVLSAAALLVALGAAGLVWRRGRA
jgi:periplasmic copper chaperone A